MKKEFGDYFLGLDIGTDSVGWAVTDMDYNIQKLNGKAMWGVRLFESGKTAEERRLHRCARRRQQRRTQRIKLLQELFSEEICKVDQAFYLRLHESKLHLEDKLIGGLSIDYAPNTLVSWYDGKEITIFDFNKVCKMDNRFTGYKIFKNKTEIVIQITGL